MDKYAIDFAIDLTKIGLEREGTYYSHDGYICYNRFGSDGIDFVIQDPQGNKKTFLHAEMAAFVYANLIWGKIRSL